MATGMKRVLDASFQRSGHFRAHHEAIISPGLTVSDIVDPTFWANVARRIRQFDMISAIAEDGSFYAELLVIATGVGFAKVKLLQSYDLEASDEAGDEDDSVVVVKWRGPARKFGVIRVADDEVLKDGFSERGDAYTFKRQYLKTIAA